MREAKFKEIINWKLSKIDEISMHGYKNSHKAKNYRYKENDTKETS